MVFGATAAFLSLIQINVVVSFGLASYPTNINIRWKPNKCSSSPAPSLVYGTSVDVLEPDGILTRSHDGYEGIAARSAEANQFRLDLEKVGLSSCHGILHAAGCRHLPDVINLAPAQMTSMGLESSHSSIIYCVRDSYSEDRGGTTSNAEQSLPFHGTPLATTKSIEFEAVCAKNDIYKGTLFTPDQCNQLKLMSERHAYRSNPSWKGMPCKSVPGYISATDVHFQHLFREMHSLFLGRIREGSIRYESANEPHLVKYGGDTMQGAPLHTDNTHKSLTINVLLSEGNDFGGGGTYIEAIDRTLKLKQGEVLIHPGNLEHAGRDITFGVRHLLVAFLECDWDDAELAGEPVLQ